jgi:hypothetical protein
MTNLATMIDEARRQGFVGRRDELARFDDILSCEGPVRVLYVHGPGGIGKTALLDQFRLRARAAGREPVCLDGRDVDCSADGFLAAFDRIVASTASGADLLLLDGYERFGPIDTWVRNEFLPSLDVGMIVVLASREPPGAPWRTDPGWRVVAAVQPLGALSTAESVDLLERAGVTQRDGVRLAALGRGHPLTLALLADAAAAGREVPDDLAEVPELVRTLVADVVGEAPSEAHATGLAVCAHAWVTTEDLVRRAVGDDAPDVWAWLESRPFVTRSGDGLHPHDLVRDALEADLRRRSPDGYLRIHRIVHEYVMATLRRPDTTDRQLWAHQKLWLHRRSPLSSAYWTMRDHGPAAVVGGELADHPAVLDLIERFEGPASAALAERWLAAQPENLSVIRSPTGLASFLFQVVYPTDPALCDADPVLRAVLDHASSTSPARPGEQVWIGRFLGGAAGYQHDPYSVVIGAVAGTIEWVTRPLAWTFVASVDPAFWGPGFSYIGFTEQLVTELAGCQYTVYGTDWRRLPLDAWIDLLGERELTGASGPAPPNLLRPPPLGRAAFDAAVRAALGDLHAPDRLQANPLMGSMLAFGVAGADVDRLRASIRAGIDQVTREPRAEPLGRVLDRTFVRPTPTQEAAAEVLSLPFSTYRRHLAKAVERLTDLLWAVEIGQVRLGVDSD